MKIVKNIFLKNEGAIYTTNSVYIQHTTKNSDPFKQLSYLHNPLKTSHTLLTSLHLLIREILICIEKQNSIKFSSAQRPIIYVQKGNKEVTIIKGCKFSIGGFSEVEKKFNILELPLDTVDKFYMTTDGYLDQFGGPNVKKIGKKNFIKMLNLIQGLPIENQKKFLLNELNNWKGDLDQIDDICLIGVDLT